MGVEFLPNEERSYESRNEAYKWTLTNQDEPYGAGVELDVKPEFSHIHTGTEIKLWVGEPCICAPSVHWQSWEQHHLIHNGHTQKPQRGF